ncbi:hypothetical protein MNBD_GAMMA21-2861 [hydrothermal vent metagenome]|uniref:Response regulatory domain-containing protein n=1 Tax=hydrothermal vent metagenome TaxID=652676 RepID=A0A3B1ALB9_9ZZZZ
MNTKKQLLAVVELGGYPDFTPIYESMGYEVTMENSVRNAIRTLKKLKPEVVVAEFNFQSDFRDRTSNLESLLSTMQWLEKSEIVIFFEKEYEHQLEKLKVQYTLHTTLPFPIEEESLRHALHELSQTE